MSQSLPTHPPSPREPPLPTWASPSLCLQTPSHYSFDQWLEDQILRALIISVATEPSELRNSLKSQLH
jgi:hypothetical protein